MPGTRGAGAVASDLLSLTKPRLSSLVLVTTAGGFVLAPGEASPWRLLLAVFGTAMTVAAANSLNCWWERNVDRRMHRTLTRPLPAGRLRLGGARAGRRSRGGLRFPFLAWVANPLSALLAALALVSYVAIYTPLKRRSSLATLVGAFPGALPPLIGWTAASGRIELPGLVLFGVLFLWQIPHFLALSIMLEDDYRRGGLFVLPIDFGPSVTRLNIVLWTLALVPASLLLVPLGVAGTGYGVAAAAAGAGFTAYGAKGLTQGAGKKWATGLFVLSIVYLTVLFAMPQSTDAASAPVMIGGRRTPVIGTRFLLPAIGLFLVHAPAWAEDVAMTESTAGTAAVRYSIDARVDGPDISGSETIEIDAAGSAPLDQVVLFLFRIFSRNRSPASTRRASTPCSRFASRPDRCSSRRSRSRTGRRFPGRARRWSGPTVAAERCSFRKGSQSAQRCRHPPQERFG